MVAIYACNPSGRLNFDIKLEEFIGDQKSLSVDEADSSGEASIAVDAA